METTDKTIFSDDGNTMINSKESPQKEGLDPKTPQKEGLDPKKESPKKESHSQKETPQKESPQKEKPKPKLRMETEDLRPRREIVVEQEMLGNKYGHPALWPLLYQKTSLTHDAYAKLTAELAKKNITLNQGLNFIESKCYFVPKELNQRTPERGESGVICHKLSSIKHRPGAYSIVSAASVIAAHVVDAIVKTMKIRTGDSKNGLVKHTLQIQHIKQTLESDDPMLANVGVFFDRWMKEVKFVEVEKAKGGMKKVWIPLHIDFPDAGDIMPLDMRYIFDSILTERTEARRKRGQALYKSLVDSGKLRIKKEPETPKEKKASNRSELAIAIASDKQKRVGESPQKALKHTDIDYDGTDHLTQKDLISRILSHNPESEAFIGKIDPAVRRFLDDLVNHIIISITDISISFMLAADSLTLSSKLAGMAIETFFTVIYGSRCSELKRKVIASAASTAGRYEAILERNRAEGTTEDDEVDAPDSN